MYAVIHTGGKQYRVCEGSLLDVEKLPQEIDTNIIFDKVLSLGEGQDIRLGEPYIAGAQVTAKVVKQYRADKVSMIKMKRRKHHMKRQGHRQYLTQVRIEGITG